MLSGGGDRSPEEPPGEAAAVAAVVDGAKAAVEGAPKSDEEIGDSVAPSIVFFSFILLNIFSFSLPVEGVVGISGSKKNIRDILFIHAYCEYRILVLDSSVQVILQCHSFN